MSTPVLEAPPVIAQLLSEARAHERLRAALCNRRIGRQHAPDYLAATASAQLALDKRLQAHDLDPAHADPAWALDSTTYEQQVAFLHGFIGRP